MNKKYALTNKTKKVNGKTLYQIIALKDFNDVKAGDLGGYIESKDNLSQYFKCWVYHDAVVCDNAVVRGDAKVWADAVVGGSTKISNDIKPSEKFYDIVFTTVLNKVLKIVRYF